MNDSCKRKRGCSILPTDLPYGCWFGTVVSGNDVQWDDIKKVVSNPNVIMDEKLEKKRQMEKKGISITAIGTMRIL